MAMTAHAPRLPERTRLGQDTSLHISRVGPIDEYFHDVVVVHMKYPSSAFAQSAYALDSGRLHTRFSALGGLPEASRFARRAMKRFMARNPAPTRRLIPICLSQSNEKSHIHPPTLMRVTMKYAG